MAVRIRVRFRAKASDHLDVVSILNGGFESEDPAVLLPEAAAKALFGDYPAGTHLVEAELAIGREEMRAVESPVEGHVLAPDDRGTAASFEVYVSPNADEALVSDTGIDALGVEVVSFGRGLWRFVGETQPRPSEAVERW